MTENRRKFLLSAAGLSAGAAFLENGFLSGFAIPDANAAESEEHFHELVVASSACIQAAEPCEAHCQEQLGKGHTEFANCNVRVHETLALTRALMTLAAMGSSHTPKLAAICADACKACSEACAEHKKHFSHGMHLQCKACMEACNDCEKACRKVAVA